MNVFKKNFFIITAHPDDLEIGCGGLISKINQNGGSVTNLILVKPSAEQNNKRNEQIVAEELKASQKILNFNYMIYDTPIHDNGRPKLELTNNLITYAESCCKDNHILISHWKEDHHQDHRICYEVARSIARNNFEQFWCMDEPPYNLHYSNFLCNLYVDITEHVDLKRKALSCYDSYFSKKNIDTIINYNTYRGSFIGQDKIAETFSIVYNKIT